MDPSSFRIAPGHITTPWAGDVDPQMPLPEYPRPQMVRPAWQNLNGPWEYAITPRSSEPPAEFPGLILVPYPIESALSGVKQALSPDECLWYHRKFVVDSAWQSGRVLLQFGAVDWQSQVFVNGKFVGEHTGGYDPFTLDITAALVEGQNDLLVAVEDPTDSRPIQRGKQVLKPGFIWYSAHSGIWQTVWLEGVPDIYITGLKLTPDVDECNVTVKAEIWPNADGLTLHARVLDQGNLVSEGKAQAGTALILPIQDANLWSPDTPHLYDLQVTLEKDNKILDRVESYFGMRKFSLGRDQQGHLRFCLNDQPLFLYGPLDQGYWPDGLSTPPTDQAVRWEITFLKEAGFNMLRKHVKVEPARYYYHCDRAGIIVWQDMVSGGISPKPIWFLFAPLFKSLRDDRGYWRLGRGRLENRQQFMLEYQRMIEHLYNVVSIAIWGPFNEGWGQFDAASIAEWTNALDPTRLVDHTSGWFDQGAGDFKSEHIYFKPLPEPKSDAARGWVLSEFGGYSLYLPGHTWDPKKDFGYKKFTNQAALTEGYLALLKDQLIPWIKAGLSAAIYTQTTDVETEINGFLTYDRKVVKMDLEAIKAAHQALYQASSDASSPEV